MNVQFLTTSCLNKCNVILDLFLIVNLGYQLLPFTPIYFCKFNLSIISFVCVINFINITFNFLRTFKLSSFFYSGQQPLKVFLLQKFLRQIFLLYFSLFFSLPTAAEMGYPLARFSKTTQELLY